MTRCRLFIAQVALVVDAFAYSDNTVLYHEKVSPSTAVLGRDHAKLEELRQLPVKKDQTDNQLLGSLAGQVITIVYPEPGATFAVGCERYPEGAIPIEIKERPEGKTSTN